MAKKRTINPSGKLQGRPPKPFYPEYCELLIQHMDKGYSFEAFGAHANCSKDTLYLWLSEYPDFLDARKEGESKCRRFWEELGIRGIQGEFMGFGQSVYIFNMKNRFGWRDAIDLNAKTQHTNVNVNLNVEGKVSELVGTISEMLNVKKEATQIKDVTPIRIKSS